MNQKTLQNHFKEGAKGEKSKKDKKDKDKNQPESPELITQKKFEKNYIRASREVLKNELATSKPPAKDLKYSNFKGQDSNLGSVMSFFLTFIGFLYCISYTLFDHAWYCINLSEA